MPGLFSRLGEWYRARSTALKILYPVLLIIVLGGLVVGGILLFSGGGEAGTLIPEGVEVAEVELPAAIQLTTGEGDDYAPAPSPDGTRLAFASDRSGNLDIYSVAVNGGDLVQLTHDTSTDTEPHYSPDSSLVAFASDRAGRDFDIWVIEATGADPKRLTVDVGDEREPRWSPIRFRTDRAYHRLLYTSEKGAFTVRDGGTDRRPVELPEGVEHARWAPHGLGYLGQAPVEEGTAIVSAGLEGILELEGFYGLAPQPAPNLTGVLFIGGVNGQYRVYYYDAARNRLLKLNQLTEPGELAWAPDAAGFYFTDLHEGRRKIFYQALPLPLADVKNLWQYAGLSTAALDNLELHGLVYPGRRHALFSDLYLAEYPGEVLFPASYHRPTYITADAVLELTDYYFDFVTRACETQTVRPALDSFYYTLSEEAARAIHRLEEARDYALASPGSQLVETVANEESFNRLIESLRFLRTYLQTGGELLVPPNQVRPEIPNPDAHASAAIVRRGTGQVPVLTRDGAATPAELFVPEARHLEDPLAADFHRAYNWASRYKFDLTDPDRALEAALLTHLLSSGEARELWNHLDGFFEFHYGTADDFDIDTLDDLLRRAYGADVTLSELADPEGLERFIAGCEELQSQIGGVDPTEAEEAPTFALFAERGWPLEDYLASLSGLPSGEGGFGRRAKLLDIAAANGGDAARRQLEIQGESGYSGYEAALDAVSVELRRNDDGLFWRLMRAVRPFLADPELPEGLEPDENHLEALGLRAAQVYCGLLTVRSAPSVGVGGGLDIPARPPAQGEIPDLGLPFVHLEPRPELFERLADLVVDHYDLLHDAGLFPEFVAQATAPTTYGYDDPYAADDEATVEELMAAPTVPAVPSGVRVLDVQRDFSALLERLGVLARQQTAEISFSEEDHRFLLGFGKLLAELTEDCLDGAPGLETRSGCARSAAFYLGESAEGPVYLNAAVGNPEEVLLLVDDPAGGRLLVVGAAWGYFERSGLTPLGRREWLTELETTYPPRPAWTGALSPLTR